MPDLIRLLPDAIANQIAAGEVVQRPASVIKELLENSLDAGADKITVQFKDGGQTLIQIKDNGKGMSDGDARMAWERHATSKIEKAQDLFSLNTFGFRGEALASIAAVARVEMKTRREEDQLGTYLLIEASEVKKQEPFSCPTGTLIAVKNLFFNIPARRNFLKSINVESRHIVEAFEKVALANPSVEMILINGENEVHNLAKSTSLERVKSIIGKKSKGVLIEVQEETDIIRVTGFIGSPEMSKRTRGDQYFFVNGRTIREPYFHHAISGAYEGLMDADQFPLYVLFMDIDPAKIDVNVHPTKTEVKFEESRAIYSILKSIARKALGSHHQTPQLQSHISGADWSPGQMPGNFPVNPKVEINKSFNPFGDHKKPKVPNNWEKLYEPFKNDGQVERKATQDFQADAQIIDPLLNIEAQLRDCFQIDERYLACNLGGELLLINIFRARQRVLYHNYKNGWHQKEYGSQQLLFPRTIEFSAADFQIISDLMEDINALGFDIAHFGKNTIIINGTPADLPKGGEVEMIEGLLHSFKNNEQELKLGKRESLLRSMARSASLKREKLISTKDQIDLVNALFSTNEPAISPSGHGTFIKFAADQLNAFFNQ